ncbi:unnamed protein product (macronuclear) [Paramecium tetraurelia]|uniref:AAA+ ATPase domain-containing protein n=1 Tax=Paramecium tetraurelia TaxID=5888 RepID=A0C737_PARTE|nr:uncharacterized protein GSPATT00035734001 [Paramecium tetraurelia]CAK66604.1 unnamed protein product [Paramecium tetraurelia]|eukprot:XP_001434001.1 hypothetical protein (macronuclear) [Paramecium tetraurelia strain d4-2]
MSNQILEEDLNQSLRLIVEGRENFQKATNYEMKQLNYSKMKKGCGELLNYIRNEKDENLKMIMSQQLKRYIDELSNFSEAMKKNQQTDEVEVVQVKKQELLYTQDSNKDIQLYNAQYAKYVEIHQPTQNNNTNIVGLESQKQILNERIALPLLFPQLFQGKRKLQTSTLLFGPRGTGKTELLRQIASECKALLIIVNISMIIEVEEQNTVQELMNQIEQQTKNRSFIIVLKQLEECKNRETLIKFFEKYNLINLVENDRLASNVIGCTNQPWNIHHSIRRIFENRIEITLMTEKQRLEFINQKLFQNKQYWMKNEEIAELAKNTKQFAGLDLKKLFITAVQLYEQKQQAKNDEDFYDCILDVLQVQKSSVSDSEIQQFTQWRQEFCI